MPISDEVEAFKDRWDHGRSRREEFREVEGRPHWPALAASTIS